MSIVSIAYIIFFTLIGLLILALYTDTRNEWVFRKQVWWVDKSYRAYRGFILSGNCLRDLREVDPYNALLGYKKMMGKFWCWDINKMIADKDAYDFVMKWDDNGQNNSENGCESF